MDGDWDDVQLAMTRFVNALDDADWDGAAAMVTEDFSYAQVGAGSLGKEEFFALARETSIRMPVALHYLTNVLVSVDGDQAEVQANAFVVHVFARGELTEMANSGARMYNRLRRTADGWRVYELASTPVWRDPRYGGLIAGTLQPGA